MRKKLRLLSYTCIEFAYFQFTNKNKNPSIACVALFLFLFPSDNLKRNLCKLQKEETATAAEQQQQQQNRIQSNDCSLSRRIRKHRIY